MSRSEPDATRIVRSWLDEGVTALPDRVLDAVLDQLPATPQRRPSWLARRTPTTVNRFVGFGLAAAAVVILAIVGIQLIGGSNIGNPPPHPSPSPEPTHLAPTTLVPGSGPLEPGDYLIADFDAFTVTVTIPSGWESLVVPAQVWGPGENRPAVGYATVEGLFADVCDPSQGYLDVGPTVDDLVQALGVFPGLYVAQTEDVAISGYEGTRVELTGAGIDCDGSEPLWMTTQPGSVDRPHPTTFWGQSQLTILDVDGNRLVIIATVPANSEPEAASDVEAMINSTVIEAP
jgi:hypothetical protein